MKKTSKQPASGFVLPVIIITSVVMMIVLLSSLSVSSSVTTALQNQYYQRLASEAAKAGVEYGSRCVDQQGTSSNWTVLYPGARCDNTSVLSNPCNNAIPSSNEPDCQLLNSGRIRSTFEVSSVEYNANGQVMFGVVGTVHVTRASSNNSIIDTIRVYKKAASVPSDFLVSKTSGNDNHSCALVTGRVHCWGLNTSGQMGNGKVSPASDPISRPVEVSYTDDLPAGAVTDIGTGNYFSCALANGNVWCWGSNTYGQLGDNTTEPHAVPRKVITTGALSGKTITKMAVGANNVCVVASGQAFCWGWNEYGQLGNNSIADSPVPVAVLNTGATSALTSKTVTDIATNDYHTCAIFTPATSANNLSCWGRNAQGQLGVGSVYAYTAVPRLAGVSGVSSVGLGSHHTCVLAGNTTLRVRCWGYNAYGQLGYGDTTNRETPPGYISGGTIATNAVTSLSVGDYHACAVVNGGAHCWGRNSDSPGQLGDGTSTDRLVPVAVSTAGVLNGKTITGVSASDFNGCAISSEKLLYCWGRNNYGQLGDGTTNNSLVPVKFKPETIVRGIVTY